MENKNDMMEKGKAALNQSKSKIIILGIIATIIILMLGSWNFLVGSNDAGYYQVKQAFGTGNMSVISSPGFYLRLGAKLEEYKVSDTYYFSKSELDGGKSKFTDPIKVRFAGGGEAMVDGSIKYKLPATPEKRLKIHEDFRSFISLERDLIAQYAQEVLKNTATLFKPEETYSGRKGEFNAIFQAQLEKGIYRTTSKQVKTKDADGNELVETVVIILKDEDGHPIIEKISPFERYGISLDLVSIKDIDYDNKIDELIKAKQNSEQQKVVARAAAEKAKQDAITAEEEGKARVAKAEADALVDKKTAIVNAEREKEIAILEANKTKEVAELEAEKRLKVAELNRKSADEDAKALLLKKEAEAKAAALLVKAGLTPQEKAEWEYKTKVGVAEQLSKVKVPEIVISGGEKGSNPMDALGIKMLMDINEQMSKSKM
jgi:regulator of protease activity HflC (stomatin/prohibitin superfamily)